VILGSALVLATWIIGVLCIGALGLAIAVAVSPSRLTATTLRMSLWWGLAVATVAILILSLVGPLSSGASAIAFLALVLIGGIAGIALARRRGLHVQLIGRRWAGWALVAAVVLCIIYLSVSSLGPVTNYDTGLYHLGAIKYASDYGTVPGLANIYFPFGYSNSEFPLAAFLGNGPWGGIGYRFLNGLFMVLMALDLIIRIFQRKLSVGTYVLIVGFAASWVPLIALSDYWITSPTSDSPVFILTIIAASYLSDALTSKRNWQVSGSIALLASVLALAMRPTMAVFAVGVATVLIIRFLRLRRSTSRTQINRRAWTAVLGIGVAIVIVQAIRDYVLSGWLQYPLSILPFDVPWRAMDPIDARRATLGAARNPLDLWHAADSWDWIPSWIGRLPSQWETFETIALFLAAVVLMVFARRLTGRPALRLLMLAITPSLIATAIWFLASPPSFRFAWGPVFTIAIVPAGWALHALANGHRSRGTENGRQIVGRFIEPVLLLSLSGLLVLLVGYCAVARVHPADRTEQRTLTLGPVSIGYQIAPIPLPGTTTTLLASGLSVLTPVDTDQCWDWYPLCSPQIGEGVAARGDAIGSGFTQ
jgi:hypothetical protein